MTYEQTIEFLYNQLPAYHRIGKAAYKNNLDNSNALDDYFENPHKNFNTIHIAGTNGKGSVSHYLASVLQEAEYKTGLYTSPHLKDFRERIRVDGQMIPKAEVVQFVEKHKVILDRIKPSFFEMCVAMSFDYFKRSKVDIAVIETGLGGRLDSTNIITPLLSVITNIGHDHFDLLGDSLRKVAAEKAGIIKHRIPVVIGESDSETSEVFLEAANLLEAEISFADSNFSCLFEKIPDSDGMQTYHITDKKGRELVSGSTPLAGAYQKKNLVTLFQIYTRLKAKFNLSDKDFIRGVENVIKNTSLQGRWQILEKRPLTICDTGHNKEGIEYVISQLKQLKFNRLHIVIGFVSDKDLSGVLPLFPRDAIYYFTKASVQRALSETILKEKAEKFGLEGICLPSVTLALQEARKKADPDDVIFIGGSNFVVAEVL